MVVYKTSMVPTEPGVDNKELGVLIVPRQFHAVHGSLLFLFFFPFMEKLQGEQLSDVLN